MWFLLILIDPTIGQTLAACDYSNEIELTCAPTYLELGTGSEPKNEACRQVWESIEDYKIVVNEGDNDCVVTVNGAELGPISGRHSKIDYNSEW